MIGYNEGGFRDTRPKHPRGMIGAMIANELIKAGWEEQIKETWVGEDRLWVKDGEVCYLEQAYERQFNRRF